MSRNQFLLIAVAVAAMAGAVAQVQNASAQTKQASYAYVGVKKCAMCHRTKAMGDQFGVWSGTAHSKAFEALASTKAKEAAKKLGIDDPQRSPECLKCHVTAFAVMSNLATQKVTMEEGVSCESCHGPGSAYSTMATMKAISAGQTKAESVGLRKPTEEACKTCHVAKGNPFYVEFKFEEAKKKIAHPRPPKP